MYKSPGFKTQYITNVVPPKHISRIVFYTVATDIHALINHKLKEHASI